MMKLNLKKNVCLNEILNTLENSDMGFFIEVDSKYPDNLKYKTKKFPFAPVKKN